MADHPPSRLPAGQPMPYRPSRGPEPRRRLLRTVALAVFGAIVLLGALGAVVAVGGFVLLSRDLPDPHSLETMSFSADSVIYDRTGTHELARFGSTACKAQYRCRDCLEPFDYSAFQRDK
jgi:membrane peptidoglycan carboxypeptidase